MEPTVLVSLRVRSERSRARVHRKPHTLKEYGFGTSTKMELSHTDPLSHKKPLAGEQPPIAGTPGSHGPFHPAGMEACTTQPPDGDRRRPGAPSHERACTTARIQ